MAHITLLPHVLNGAVMDVATADAPHLYVHSSFAILGHKRNDK